MSSGLFDGRPLNKTYYKGPIGSPPLPGQGAAYTTTTVDQSTPALANRTFAIIDQHDLLMQLDGNPNLRLEIDWVKVTRLPPSVIRSTRGALRREEFVTQPEYYYSYDKNYSDAQLLVPDDPPAGLARSFSASVWIVDTYGRQSLNPATLVVQNPGSGLPTGLEFSANIGTIWASFNPPRDPDWQGFKLWGSTVSGFTPDDNTNLIGQSNVIAGSFNTFKDGTPILPGTTYYLRLALYDAFGDAIELLTLTSEYAVTTGSVDISNLPVYTFDPVPIFTLVPGNPDVLGWTASGVTVTYPVSGTSSVYAIAAGSVAWGGRSIYISYQDRALALEASTDVGLHTHSDRTLMATWEFPGGQNITAFNGKAGISGELIYAHTITGNALVTDTAIINYAAQIAQATINNGHITDLDAGKILARSIISQVLYIGAHLVDVSRLMDKVQFSMFGIIKSLQFLGCK